MSFILSYKGIDYLRGHLIEAAEADGFAQTVNQFLETWYSNSSFVFKSSGSTGPPKTFKFTRDQLISSARATIQALDLNCYEHILMCIHPSFVGGAMMLARALTLDCRITLLEPSASVFEAIEHGHTYTFASFVPLQILNTAFSRDKFMRIRNVLIGGTKVSELVLNKVKGAGNRVYHTYGMTETLSHIALRDLNSDKGFKALRFYEVRQNESGCICVKPPFLDQELCTSDLIEYRVDGTFDVTGRIDFIINSGGIKINPEEVESELSKVFSMPEFEYTGNFVVVQQPSAMLGEELVLLTEIQFSEEQIRRIKEELTKRLNRYKIPKVFLATGRIPLTETGKPARFKIIEALKNQVI